MSATLPDIWPVARGFKQDLSGCDALICLGISTDILSFVMRGSGVRIPLAAPNHCPAASENVYKSLKNNDISLSTRPAASLALRWYPPKKLVYSLVQRRNQQIRYQHASHR